jgi:predicted protein tyrosine phosphatase
MIHVCPLSRITEVAEGCRADRMVTLLTEGTPVARPAHMVADNHLVLSMHDIVEEMPDMTAPNETHVEALLDFASRWDRRAPMLIHCFAGISRSTAAAYVVAAALAPHRDEAELALRLRRASATATPNIRIVSIADRLLGREGRMISAIQSIGRGIEAMEGIPFSFAIDAR